MSPLRHYLAVGSGVGIELDSARLRIVISKVRPSGIEVVDAHTIEKYTERPAAEWGNEYTAFLRKHGAGHLAATVLLPRREMIVRLITLPGVADKDTEAALLLQIDAHHPYAEGEAAWTWARLANHSILLGIARQSYIDRQVELFTEAGIKVSAFTFSGAAIYSALRLHGTPPAEGFVGLMETETGVEAYGESPAKAVYSATYEQSWERAASQAMAELRLTENVTPRELAAILPAPRSAPEQTTGYALAYLASLAAACPRFALKVNLLPAAQRSTTSRLLYVPTVILGAILVLGLAALGLYQRYEDRRYLAALESEITFLEPKAKRLAQVDLRVQQAQARTKLLDQFQTRTRQDLDALREATKVIAPPAWLNTLELNRVSLVVAGEADQAAGLLKSLDSSPQFQNSEFLVPLSRVGPVEVFRIRSSREGVQ